ncbi:MAG: HAD family phosphatase [Caulobacterales bacterium]
MIFPRAVKAIVFDMDGLLLDTEALVMQAMMRAGERFGIDVPLDFIHSMVGLPGAASEPLFYKQYGDDFALPEYYGLVREEMAVLTADGAPIKTGVHDLLDELDAQELPRAVATSTRREFALTRLEKAGLLPRFDKIIAGGDYVNGKPHPEPFLTAAAALGVAPANCIALEDSYNGVRAAHAAGMMTVMVPDLLQPIGEMHEKAVAIAQTLHDVRDWLKR